MKKSAVSILAFGLALMITAPLAAAETCGDPRPLRLALVPIKDPTLQLTQYQPLIKRLGIVLSRRIEVVPSTSYGSVVEGLLAGGIDLAELGPASFAMAMGRGAKISTIASFRLREGATTEPGFSYKSLLITRRANGIKTIGDLRGGTLSLTDPASTSGAILPRHAMEKQLGLPLNAYFKRVTFAGSHDRSIEIVRNGQVDAAFVSSTALDEAIRRGKLRLEDIQILWKSSTIPYDPFVHRTQLCPALVEKIRQVFLGDTSSLQDMFKELGMTGFAPVSDEHYREIRMLYPSPK